MDAAFNSEVAEARRQRIECRNQAGRFLDSSGDMKWLYFDLVLRGALETNEQTLRELVHRLHWENAEIHEIVEQATRFIDQPLLHCTELRDLFIVRLVQGLTVFVRDPIRDRLVILFRTVSAVLLLLLLFVLYALVNRWVAAGILFLLIAKMVTWFRDPEKMQRCTIRNHATREQIKKIVSVLHRGGFDELTIIRQLEALDNKVPPLPRLIYIYNCPYFLGSDPSGIQEHSIPIPEVLYALLRLPRRNPRGEISAKISALGERKSSELARGWRRFVDPMLHYSEPQTISG